LSNVRAKGEERDIRVNTKIVVEGEDAGKMPRASLGRAF
jgi:hypothetical protein